MRPYRHRSLTRSAAAAESVAVEQFGSAGAAVFYHRRFDLIGHLDTSRVYRSHR
jgi:hypothetical protein